MKIFIKNLILVFCLVAAFGIFQPVLAATPYLSVSSSGNGINLFVSNADPNYPIDLVYINPGTNMPSYITNPNWYTDYNGNFSTYISMGSYDIASGAQIYVVVDGQQSGSYQYGYDNGCSYNCGGNYGSLSFSQSSISLTAGQSVSVSIYASYYYNGYNSDGNYYVASNSNPNIAAASISGSGLYVAAYSPGSSTITVCLSGSNICGSVYVSVSAYVYYYPAPQPQYYPYLVAEPAPWPRYYPSYFPPRYYPPTPYNNRQYRSYP